MKKYFSFLLIVLAVGVVFAPADVFADFKVYYTGKAAAMFGSGDSLKTKAMDVIYEAARTLDPMRQMEPLTVDWAAAGLNIHQ